MHCFLLSYLMFVFSLPSAALRCVIVVFCSLHLFVLSCLILPCLVFLSCLCCVVLCGLILSCVLLPGLVLCACVFVLSGICLVLSGICLVLSEWVGMGIKYTPDSVKVM